MPAVTTPDTAAPPLACVVVSYNAPQGLAGRLDAALAQTDLGVLVDNGSRQAPDLSGLSAPSLAKLALISNASNVGLAAALNQGIAHCAARGAARVLLLDHDSTVAPDLVAALSRAGDENTAIRVPAIRYAHGDNRCRWPSSEHRPAPLFRLLYADQMVAPAAVDLAIGSGMLIDVTVWQQIGGFDEALFIDLVDTEYCLRARQHGYRIIAVPEASLQHALGQASRRRLLGAKVFPTHHSATRHYFISRNRILLARRYARRFPAWMAYELLSGIKLLVKVVLFEDARMGKLGSMVRGTLDGLRGRSGPRGAT